jgi:hypothetical protein
MFKENGFGYCFACKIKNKFQKCNVKVAFLLPKYKSISN